MNRPITGFRLDDRGDWTALLSCGHAQHGVGARKQVFVAALAIVTAEGA